MSVERTAATRICHGLSGETLLVEEHNLPWKKLYDVIVRRACEQWRLEAADLIVLEGGGSVVAATSSSTQPSACDEPERASRRDVFIFSRSALSSGSDASIEQVTALEVPEESFGAGQGGTVHPDDELLRLRAEGCDPAVEAFRANITEARRQLAEAKHALNFAKREEARLEVQRLAAQAALDNLANQRTTCSRSLALFHQKYERVQERLDQSLGQVESSMADLSSTVLHPATRSGGRETLADVIPQDRISRFTANMQAERERLGQRLDKLKQRHNQLQELCEQVVEKTRQFPHEDAVSSTSRALAQEHAHIEEELLPELCACVPPESASSSVVLEDEKRSSSMLEGIKSGCTSIWDLQVELRGFRAKQRLACLQRLREISFIQSKLRDVEREAVLLEEETNAHKNHAQQLTHLRLMPKAYQKMLVEIARRRNFRGRFMAQSEQAKGMLARMMEDENARRRNFMQRDGCHLPADLLQGLGSLVPLATIAIAEFDSALPEIDFPLPLQSETIAAGSVGASAASAACVLHLSAASSSRGAARPAGVAADGGSGGSGSGTAGVIGTASAENEATGAGCSSGGSGEQALSRSATSANAIGVTASSSADEQRMAVLEARNRALEKRVAELELQNSSMSIDIGDANKSIGSVCQCGSAFDVDSVFCKICGAKRPGRDEAIRREAQ